MKDPPASVWCSVLPSSGFVASHPPTQPPHSLTNCGWEGPGPPFAPGACLGLGGWRGHVLVHPSHVKKMLATGLRH